MVMFYEQYFRYQHYELFAVSKVTKTLGDTGCIPVCELGTKPVACVMVEAPDQDTCQKYVDEVVNVICKNGYKA